MDFPPHCSGGRRPLIAGLEIPPETRTASILRLLACLLTDGTSRILGRSMWPPPRCRSGRVPDPPAAVGVRRPPASPPPLLPVWASGLTPAEPQIRRRPAESQIVTPGEICGPPRRAILELRTEWRSDTVGVPTDHTPNHPVNESLLRKHQGVHEISLIPKVPHTVMLMNTD